MADHDEFRFCGNPDYMGASGSCKWHQKEITWTITGQVPGISPPQLKDAYELAWSYWAEVCDLKPRYVSSTSQAMVVMDSGRIDGPGKTLAWSEMPCGRVNSLDQKYDTTEKWIIAENPRNGIDMVRVAAHEIGHAIGIPHISNGNLMAPTYNRNVRKPQAGDIDEAVFRYGKPKVDPVDPKPKPNPWSEILAKFIEAILKWLRGN